MTVGNGDLGSPKKRQHKTKDLVQPYLGRVSTEHVDEALEQNEARMDRMSSLALAIGMH